MTKRKVTHYPLEFKESSAKLAVDSDQPLSKTADALGVHVSTLSGWVQKYYPQKPQAIKASSQDSSLEELKQLRKDNVRLRQERDILKKAAAYFAGEIK